MMTRVSRETETPGPDRPPGPGTMTPGDRVRLALALGERDLETFRRSHRPPLTREEALRRLQQQRQAGRRPSGVMTSLTG